MAKTREQKNADVQALADAFDSSKLAVLTDYRGLDVASISELRAKLREAGVSYKVAKNTLVRIALAQTKLKDADTSVLTGPMAIAFGADEVEAARVVYEFGRDHEELEIIGALDDTGRVLATEEVVALAKLPSREQLTAQVVGTIAAPLSGFVRVLNGNITGLVYALSAIQEKKGA